MKKIGYLFLILSIICTGIIWSFSLKNATDSTEQSNYVTNAIEEVVGKILEKDIEIDTNIVRKAAHFTEFFVLGILVFLTFYNLKTRIYTKILLITCGWTFLTAVTDELLQLMSYGRSSQIFDVLIDFSGSLLAIAGLTLIFCKKIKTK